MPSRPPVPNSVRLAEAIDHHALMLCEPTASAFEREGWVWEAKIEGFRVLVYRQGNDTRLLSRNGNELGGEFPEIIDSLAAIDCDCVLDGELTIHDVRGWPNSGALRTRSLYRQRVSISSAAVAQPATLHLFDVLARRRRDVRPASFASRRIALEDLVKSSERVCVIGQCVDGPTAICAVTSVGLSGVVGKKLDAPYRAGRSESWLKVRARDQSRR